MMPKIAEGDANKVWIVPSEIGKALEGLGSTMNSLKGIPDEVEGPRTRVDMGPAEPPVPDAHGDRSLAQAHDAVAEAIAAAESSADLTGRSVPPAAEDGVSPDQEPPAR
jgi:hypothetical protein